MDFRFSAADERFRDEVQGFLSRNLSPELRAYATRMTSVCADKAVALEWPTLSGAWTKAGRSQNICSSLSAAEPPTARACASG